MGKGFVNTYLLGGLLILILMGGAFYFGKYTGQQSSLDIKSQILITPTTSVFTNQIPNKTAEVAQPEAINQSIKPGWEKFTDNSIGFSYQLPISGWERIYNPPNLTCDLQLTRNQGDQYICVKAFDNPKGYGRRDFYCREWVFKGNGTEQDIDDRCFNYLQTKEIKIGNIDALKVWGVSGDYPEYLLNHNNKIVLIFSYAALFPHTPNSTGFSWTSLSEEIIQTFQFN